MITPALPALAQGAVTINAFDRKTGAPLPVEWRYLITQDIANTNASTTNPKSYSPIVAQGSSATPSAVVNLPAGRYLVTVLAGPFPAVPGEIGRDCLIDDPCGYKLGGQHFTVGTGATSVSVGLVPNPLPLATLRVRVFHDNQVVNGEDDIPIETGIANMPVTISDGTGEVTVDFFGNPLCGGECKTDPDGYAVIPNIPPLKYEVEVRPPTGSGWIQTTTIEGTHVIDAWVEENASGFSTEVGFLTAAVWVGFVKECQFGNTGDSCPTNDTVPVNAGSIKGRVRELTTQNDAPGAGQLGRIVPSPYIALNNLSGNDEQIYTGRGNANGTFLIPNVPPGQYQLTYWDFAQDFIIQFATVTVGPSEVVDIGDIGLPRWFGMIRGYAYIDTGIAKNGTVITSVPVGKTGPDGAKPGYANGYRDCLPGATPFDVNQCEPGLPNQDFAVRFKDGTIKYGALSDSNGYYEFPEYFEWEHFLIWEVGFGRFKHVATNSYYAGSGGNPIGYPYNPINGPALGLAGLLQAQTTWAGTYQWIDAGKLPYSPGENGGISGIVYYATTRNEFNPRLAAVEDYEPGVPDVTINLYQAALDSAGQPIVCTAVGLGCPYGQGELKRATNAPIDAVQTDSWSANLPTNCKYRYPIPGSPEVRNDPLCLELPRTWNQIKDGVFDGGYAFEGTPAGQYIVEVVPPTGYQQIREEDQNTDQGDDFVPQVPPPPCAGPLHLVNDPRNPAHNTMTPLCNSKLVTVVDGFNAPAEFQLMTINSVPPPGMIRGLLVDDLILQLDPNNPLYIQKRGIPNTPIGVLDFQNNEIARVYSDANGYWEVTLPSSYTAHCPVPGGICPGMYRIVGNYPGNPLNPDSRWNPNYGTLSLIFDVWPGKTTYADVALLPTTNLVPDPTTGFVTPPRCDVATDTPDVQKVSRVFGAPGTAFTITGVNFGATAGTVRLGNSSMTVGSWSNTTINVTVPGGQSGGPNQLIVTAANGKSGATGITFHIISGAYAPTVREVGIGKPFATIQAAIDAANNGDLVVVHEGIYFESLILGKNIKLQGHGPNAAIIDGRFFNFGGMTPQQFLDKVAATPYDGPAAVPMGQVITILATNGQFGSGYTTQIDGFAIRGGSVVRGNVPIGAAQQGGGIYAHAYARHLQISNNLVQTNSGLTGGGIIIGRAYTTNPDAGNASNSENDNVRIRYNRVLNNGGRALAGAIALFNGADNYTIDRNIICGNYAAEYGGGISHFGLSNGGQIYENQILFNYAFDEGGGVLIGGELPTNLTGLSPGSGAATIERNLIQGNVSNDDGGGIRLLQPVDGPVTIQNNMVVNNLATDAGGGIALDDALVVRIINNTIAKNISTATAQDADRSTCNPPILGSCPHAAGLTSEAHSAALRAARNLPPDSFSDPVLFNNIIWGNEAFYLNGTGGLPSAGIRDIEVVRTVAPRFMTPNFSLLTAAYGSGTGNVIGNPQFLQEINLQFVATPFAGDPAFVVVLIISKPTDPPGNYHVAGGSLAVNRGTAALNGVTAPCVDFDNGGRPVGAVHDIGADEQPGAAGLCNGVAPQEVVYVSSSSNGTAGGVNFNDEDILAHNPANNSWTLVFDGSLVGITGDVDGFDFQPDGTLLLSLEASIGSLPGLPTGADDSDIVRFTPTTPGNYTAGTYSMFFDASDVGLSATDEDVDALGFTPDGRLVVSTIGNFSLPTANGGFSGQDEDLIVFTGTLGAVASGTWQLFFDGSVFGLTSGSEDLWGTVLEGGKLYLTTSGDFSVAGASGTGADIFTCTPTPASLNAPITACTFAPFWVGSLFGFGGEVMDGLDILPTAQAAAVAAMAPEVAAADALIEDDDPSNGDTSDDEVSQLDAGSEETEEDAAEEAVAEEAAHRNFLPLINR